MLRSNRLLRHTFPDRYSPVTTDFPALFARDPLEMTKADITEIVVKMRASRKAFNLGNAKAGSTKKPTAKQKQISELSAKLDIDL